jgi:DNA-binding beta-propeller fold protein YncE
MAVINGKGYVVVNNSGKIEIVNMNDFKSIGTITGFNSPRYILQTAPDKAYVTDLYSNSISVVNLTTGMISAKISCLGWTEQLVKAGNNVFVTNPDKGKVYVINSLTDVIIDSIAVTKGAGSAVIDNAGKLWVMCSGSSSSSINGALHKINTGTDSIESTFAFTASDSPGRLTKNGAGDTLFYLNKGINKMAASSSSLPSSIFIPEGGRNLYGLGIDPLSSKIYAADAIDYVQSGKIYVYNTSGQQLAAFLAGIIPGGFLFY